MPKVNTKVMEWALAWNNLSPDELASTSDYKYLPQWLSGDKQPTMKQLEKFAARTHTIVPYYFMDDVPSVRLQIPDFRTQTGKAPSIPSPELFETIDEMLMRQGWMSDYFKDAGYEALEFIGKFDIDSVNVFDAANYLHELLGLDPSWANVGNYEDNLRKLRKAMEAKRISVSIGGYAKNNTKRTFKVAEFRGFVLADEYAPLVFVNGRDATVAKIFTLVHELAHLLFADTGLINDDGEISEADLAVEHKCDRIAAEFLAPSAEFSLVWNRAGSREKAIEAARKHFKISYVTCIRRALEMGYIGKKVFWQLYDDLLEFFENVTPSGLRWRHPRIFFNRFCSSFWLSTSSAFLCLRTPHKTHA